MYKAIFYTHQISVTLFLLIYLIKTILLLANNKVKLASFTKMVKVPEIIVSVLFLGTGIYMLKQIPEVNKFMIIKLICVFVSIPVAIIGFKKANKAMAAVSLLLIIGAYGLAEMSKMKKGATENTPKTISNTDGPTIYRENCAKCHGDDGKAGIMGAADLSVSKLDKEITFNTIKEGKGQMTGFYSVLNDDQIHAVMDYIKTLKK